MVELGFPGMNMSESIGLLTPAGTPIEIIEQIAQATGTAVAEPSFQRTSIDAGIEPTLLDSDPKIPCGTSQPMLHSGRQSSKRWV